MSVWPRGAEPFYGGTYFPPAPLGRRASRGARGDARVCARSVQVRGQLAIVGRLREVLPPRHESDDGRGVTRSTRRFVFAPPSTRGAAVSAMRPSSRGPSSCCTAARVRATGGPSTRHVLVTLRAMALGGMRDHSRRLSRFRRGDCASALREMRSSRRSSCPYVEAAL